METDNAWSVPQLAMAKDGMAENNQTGNLAEDLRILAHAQNMAMMAQTDAGKRMFDLFVEKERQRIDAYRLPVSGLGHGGTQKTLTEVRAD